MNNSSGIWVLVCLIVIIFTILSGCSAPPSTSGKTGYTAQGINKFKAGDIVSNKEGGFGLLILDYNTSSDRYTFVQGSMMNQKWTTSTSYDGALLKISEPRKTTEADNPLKLGYFDSRNVQVNPPPSSNRQPKFSSGDVVSKEGAKLGELVIQYSESTDEYTYVLAENWTGTWVISDNNERILIKAREPVEKDSPGKFGYIDPKTCSFCL